MEARQSHTETALEEILRLLELVPGCEEKVGKLTEQVLKENRVRDEEMRVLHEEVRVRDEEMRVQDEEMQKLAACLQDRNEEIRLLFEKVDKLDKEGASLEGAKTAPLGTPF